MNSKSTSSPAFDRPVLLSATEQTVLSALQDRLSDQFEITAQTPTITVEAGGTNDFTYAPDFVIEDKNTGKRFPVEVKVSDAVSLANEVQFTLINKNYKQLDQDFILLVLGNDERKALRKNRLEHEGVKTVWADSSGAAAVEMKGLLGKLREQAQEGR